MHLYLPDEAAVERIYLSFEIKSWIDWLSFHLLLIQDKHFNFIYFKTHRLPE